MLKKDKIGIPKYFGEIPKQELSASRSLLSISLSCAIIAQL